jgi:predicted nucleotidyltransferase
VFSDKALEDISKVVLINFIFYCYLWFRMLTQQNILNFLSENKLFLREQFHIEKIGIFGSFARNEQNPDSDIDILIEMENNVSNVYDLKWNLREFLKNQFQRDVDICNSKHIKPYAKDYILKDAIYV